MFFQRYLCYVCLYILEKLKTKHFTKGPTKYHIDVKCCKTFRWHYFTLVKWLDFTTVRKVLCFVEKNFFISIVRQVSTAYFVLFSILLSLPNLDATIQSFVFVMKWIFVISQFLEFELNVLSIFCKVILYLNT